MSNAPEGSPGPVDAPPRKRTRLLVVALVMAGLALAVGVPYYLVARQYESTDDAFIEGHVVPVAPRAAGQVVRVAVKDNQLVQAGDLLVEIDPADAKVRLDQASAAHLAAQARLAGAVVNLALTELVSQADLEAADAGVKMAQDTAVIARAGVQVAASKVEQAKAHAASATATVEQTRAQIAADEAEAERTAADLERYQQLIKTGSITQQLLGAATAASRSAAARLTATRKAVLSAQAQAVEAAEGLKAAQVNVTQAQAQLEQADSGVLQARARRAQVDVKAQRVAQARSQREAAEAEVKLAGANVRQAELQVSYTRVVAPQGGRVSRKTVQVGSYVQVGQPMLAVVPLEVWVVANYKETQLTHMKKGQPVTVRVDAYPGRSFAARVDSLQAGTGARFSLLPPENATGNYVKVVQRVPVKIVFDADALAADKDLLLAPGMSVVPEVKVR